MDMAQPPVDHACVTTTKAKAAAAARIGAGLAGRKRAELLGRLRSYFARPEPWLQAGKYIGALVSGGPRRNGWTIAEQAGTGRRTGPSGCSAVLSGTPSRRWARYASSLWRDWRRRHGGWGGRRGLAVGALDETGAGQAGPGHGQRQASLPGVRGPGGENGITTVHLSYIREKTGHALAGARQWIPAGISVIRRGPCAWPPEGTGVPYQEQLAIDICAEVLADGIRSASCAGTRSTETARSCGSSSKTAARATCCGPVEFHLTLAAGAR